MFHKFRVSKNDSGERGLVFTILRRNCFAPQSRNISQGNHSEFREPFCAVFQKVSLAKS